MKQNVFKFKDYKEFLTSRLGPTGLGKGGRARLCEAMGCKTSYLSQVLNANAQLSSEQADAINRFFAHSEDESEYFLLLVQLARAATMSLRQFTQRQLERALARRARLKHRIDVPQKLNLEQQVRYYSSWHYAAIHVATTIPALRTAESLARRLGLDQTRVARALEFLASIGLLERTSKGYEPTTKALHLADDSDLVGRYHSAWRFKASEALENPRAEHLHYSSVVTLGREDVPKVRELFVDALAEAKKLIRASGSEQVQVLAMDWFEL